MVKKAHKQQYVFDSHNVVDNNLSLFD